MSKKWASVSTSFVNEPFANFYGLLNEGNGISAAAVCPNKSPTVVEFKLGWQRLLI